MIPIEEFIPLFTKYFGKQEQQPWEIIKNIQELIFAIIPKLDKEYHIEDGIAIHKTAVIESNTTLKPPVIIGPDCFIGANAYLRGGVFLSDKVKIGTSCEIKSSVILDESAVAHFNFIGDSLIGSYVNFEAGSITANHYNERKDKRIFVFYDSKIIETNTEKFGAVVGDYSKIGANAVLSPGTILPQNSIVKRLELVEQIKP